MSIKSIVLASTSAVAFSTAAFADGHMITLTPVGTYASGVWDEGVAEISSYSASNQTLYVLNGDTKSVDMLDLSDVTAPAVKGSIDVDGKPNSVVVAGDMIAVALEGDEVDSLGHVGIYTLEGETKAMIQAGVLPDAVAYSAAANMVATANEGEPNDDWSIDPEGSITVVDLGTMEGTTISLAGITAQMLDDSVHLPSIDGTSLAQDLEPEYVAFNEAGTQLYVSMQENNAMAVVDLASLEIVDFFGLGVKNWNNFEMDASDKDGAINFASYNVLGLYQPDTIHSYSVGGVDYIVTANEGDARDYDGYSEETRVAKLTLDAEAYPNAAELQEKTVLGRLKTTTAKGDLDGDGDIDQIYAYGGRSFSIYSADGTQVFDSGDEIGKISAELVPTAFNGQGVNDSFDNRSDDKAGEPEALELGVINGQRFAFVGLERQGGVFVYNITDPMAASFVTYANNVDLTAEAEIAGDIAPESIEFISAEDSPNGKNLIAVANEVSGSVTIYEIN